MLQEALKEEKKNLENRLNLINQLLGSTAKQSVQEKPLVIVRRVRHITWNDRVLQVLPAFSFAPTAAQIAQVVKVNNPELAAIKQNIFCACYDLVKRGILLVDRTQPVNRYYKNKLSINF